MNCSLKVNKASAPRIQSATPPQLLQDIDETPSNTEKAKDTILIEDFSEMNGDATLVREYLTPYLRDLYNDLIIRCIQPAAVQAQMLDKITFMEFSCLPAIVAERIFDIFDKRSKNMLSVESFIEAMLTIFLS